MTKDHYIQNGFTVVGKMVKDTSNSKKKYGVYVTWNEDFEPFKKMGVYIITNGCEIMKIGETQNAKDRFQCYESHSGPTNAMVRESMSDDVTYDILFIECPSYNVGFAGVRVPSGINYRFLEKALLKQYVHHHQALPRWNKGIQ